MNRQVLVIMAILFTSTLALNAQVSKNDIVGVWLSEEKDTKFEIFEKNNKYYGKILWGNEGDIKDVKNPNPKLRNRDLVGLEILKNFEFNGKNTWEDGTIYDPRKGETYDCYLKLQSNNKLKVRGFVGISLFGRTEIWTRTQP